MFDGETGSGNEGFQSRRQLRVDQKSPARIIGCSFERAA